MAVIGVLLATLLAACGERELQVVQLRWCVMLGTDEAEGADTQTLLTTFRKDGAALSKANEIWAPAGILFVSVVAERDGVKGVPVIRDPDTDQTGDELPADIDAGDFSTEPWDAAMACQRAWLRLDDSLEGPIVVTVRRYFGVGLKEVFGVSSGPSPELLAGGQREEDLCSEPRNLAADDVLELDGRSDHPDVGYVTIAEPSQFFNPNHHGRVLAHELGHVLMLGHGNGLDDNADGSEPDASGPRRYDEYCDALSTAEDVEGPCNSLMEDGAPCTPLTKLQIEHARAAAAAMPGCSGECN
jgi:hypothetical protein